MAELDIRLLSADTSQPLTFAKISDFDPIESVSTTDYLLVSGFRNGEEITQRIKIHDIAEFFNHEIVVSEAKWFAPEVDYENSIIHWRMRTIAETGVEEGDTTAAHPVYPINILDLIGDVTDEKSGLLPPSYKAILDSLGDATESSSGLMTAADKTKLNGIEAQANKYILPTASTDTLGGVKVDGTTIVIDQNGVIRSTGGTPMAYDITLPISSWDVSTGMLHVNLVLDTNNRNVVDVDPSSLDEWVDCRVHAVSEDPSGITFACQRIPLHTLNATVISMSVARPSS